MRPSRREPWERGYFFSILDVGGGEDVSKFPSILSKTVAFLVACVKTSPISFVAHKGNRRRLHAGNFFGRLLADEKFRKWEGRGASSRGYRLFLSRAFESSEDDWTKWRWKACFEGRALIMAWTLYGNFSRKLLGNTQKRFIQGGSASWSKLLPFYSPFLIERLFFVYFLLTNRITFIYPA